MKNPIPLRWRPLVAYLLVAAACFYSIAGVRSEANNRRVDLAKSAVVVTQQGCDRDNQTRSILRGIIQDGINSLKQYKTDGLLNEVQYQRALKQQLAAIKSLPGIDCEKVVKQLTKG